MSCDLLDERPGYRQSMSAVSFPSDASVLSVATIKKFMCGCSYDSYLIVSVAA